MKIEGIEALQAYLRKLMKTLDNMEPILRRVGIRMERDFKTFMTLGIEPDGTPLTPTQPWTRFVGAGAGRRRTGKPKPLINTGILRASMGTQSVGPEHLEFGFHGRQLDKADKIIKGAPGFMRVREKRIKDFYSGIRISDKGEDYVRIRTADGWISKKVTGNHVFIKPAPRNFFYLTDRYSDFIVKQVEEWISKQVESAA